MPEDEICIDLVDSIIEHEMVLVPVNEDVCYPQGLTCHLIDGTWSFDGSIGIC